MGYGRAREKIMTKTCQHCATSFEITADDMRFYERIHVPPPTWCPECRMIRRMTWRNERSLHKRKCDAPGHNEVLISAYSPGEQCRIYDHMYWWSDKWDALEFRMSYDFTKPFFGQFAELLRNVPYPNLININDVNSAYCNFTYQSRNCYLNFASDMNEDTAYLYHSIHNKNSYDLFASKKQEMCYETIDAEDCYRCSFVYSSEGCLDSSFLYNCRNCQKCFGCISLRNAKHRIFNKQYSPEEYLRKLKEIEIGSYASLRRTSQSFRALLLRLPRKFAD